MARKKTKTTQDNLLFTLDDPGAFKPPLAKIYTTPNLGDYHLITSVTHLATVVEREFHDCAIRAFDTEFLTFDDNVTAFDPRGKLHGISIARIARDGSLKAWYIPVGHRNIPQIPIKSIRAVLGQPLTSLGWAIHGKIDIHIMRRFCGILPTITFETQIAANFLGHTSRRLKSLVDTVLGWPSLTYDQATQLPLLGNNHIDKAAKHGNHIPFQDLDPEIVVQYACQDAGATAKLAQIFSSQLEHREVYHRVYLPALYPLCDMEWNGAYISMSGFADLIPHWHTRMREIEANVQNLMGYDVAFNDNGFRDILYNRFGLKSNRKTTIGMDKIDSQAIEEAEKHVHDDDQRTVIANMKTWKELQKLVTTYDMRNHCLHALTTDANIGVVHPTFSLHTTRTGRASSQNPNFQNIPTRKKEGAEIRRRFIAQDHEILIVGDMSQMEPRITAWYTALYGDDILRQSYKEGRDIYLTFMTILVDEEYNELDQAYKNGDKRVKGLRDVAKIMFLAIAYLSGAQSLAENPKMDVLFDTNDTLPTKTTKVQQLIDTILERLPGLRTYYTRAICQAYRDGYVYTGWNYQRDIPEIRFTRRADIMSGIRYAVNAPIQGMNANLIFASTVWMRQLLNKYDLNDAIELIGTVHDEVDVRATKTHTYVAAALVQHCLSRVADLDGIPIAVDIEVGQNWADIKGLTIPKTRTDLHSYGGVDQDPRTWNLITAIQNEPSPYLDMPIHPLPPAPAFDTMPIEEAISYMQRLAMVNIPVDSGVLPAPPDRPETTIKGLVIESYTGTRRRDGTQYTRVLLAYRGGYQSVIVATDTHPEPGMTITGTGYQSHHGTMILKTWIEQVPTCDPIYNAIEEHQSILIGATTVHGERLAHLCHSA